MPSKRKTPRLPAPDWVTNTGGSGTTRSLYPAEQMGTLQPAGRESLSVRSAIYARVSTADQNCEMQLRELREYCARRGWDVATEYVDQGWSGAKSSRPQLDRLMADARRRRLDTVLVWKLDRWGRSLAHLVYSVQELSGLGIRFIAVTQNIDTDESNPMARLLLHLMGAFAEFEREMIRDRTLSGVRTARARGKVLGRPRRVFRRDEVVRLRQQGSSWRAIAECLGVAVSTVRDAYRCAEIVPRSVLNSPAQTESNSAVA